MANKVIVSIFNCYFALALSPLFYRTEKISGAVFSAPDERFPEIRITDSPRNKMFFTTKTITTAFSRSYL